MDYIKTQEEFHIKQPIFGSANTDTVSIQIVRESDDKYWDFDENEFVTAEKSANMSFVNGAFWSAKFTPPEDDKYMVTIEDSDLPYLARGEYDDDLECILAYEYDTTTIYRVFVSVAGGTIDYGWSAQTKIDICNLVIRMLGAKTITSLDDSQEEARILDDIYDRILDEVLMAYPWNFAIKRVSLSQLAETPSYEFDYAYALPDDYLRILEVEDEGYVDYQLENNKLLTDEESISVRYLARVTDPTEYSPIFIQAFTARLAAEMAYPLTGDASLSNSKMEEFQLKVSQARSTNAQEGKARTIERTSWLENR